MSENGRQLVAILVSIPAGDDGLRALRAFLKSALRTWGIRCHAIRPPADTVTFGAKEDEGETNSRKKIRQT